MSGLVRRLPSGELTAWGDEYSYIGAVVGATYPEMGKVLREIMPKSYILVPGYGAQGGQEKTLFISLTKTDLVRS